MGRLSGEELTTGGDAVAQHRCIVAYRPALGAKNCCLVEGEKVGGHTRGHMRQWDTIPTRFTDQYEIARSVDNDYQNAGIIVGFVTHGGA